ETIKYLLVVPNPASSVITVGSPCPDGSLVSIFNASGEEMISTKSDENTTSINISTLPPGLYFVRLSNDKTVEVGKFVKQ
ncbi:MAG TPA: T9SS type A sorting domain-containing protein, partial [Bacteroidales bacterium]|nr:T9SS type A sorting domain-containing protein [Bacteroidales bacterium]